MENKETFTVSRKHSDDGPCCSLERDDRNHGEQLVSSDNTSENMSHFSSSSLNDWDDCEITSLPALHIEHNSSAIFKLILLYALTWFVALFGIGGIIAFVINGFSILVRSKSGLELYVALIVVLCILVGILTLTALAKSSAYFKKRFLRGELEAFCELNSLQVDAKYVTFTSRMIDEVAEAANNVKKDYILLDSTSVINCLGIGGCIWSNAQFSDDITGNYLGMPFRFLDVLLTKITQERNSSHVDNIFGGQIFIFKTNLNIQKPIQYNYNKGKSCKKRSDFEEAFAASYYSAQMNPFDITQLTDREKEAFAVSYYSAKVNPFDISQWVGRKKMVAHNSKNEAKNDDFLELETPDFVDNMLRLGLRLPDHIWGVRFDGDNFVLVIFRFLNVFELSRLSVRRSLANLDRDMQEFVDILSTVSQMGFIKKA